MLVSLLARSETSGIPEESRPAVNADGEISPANVPVCEKDDCSKKTPIADSRVTLKIDDVVVTGKRLSLQTAQEIKQEKIEIVDSVVADEILKLPDISVSEAMQRISGIQINRDRGESPNITIRGLSQVETLVNGREVFTAGSGRNLNFSDIPTEQISAINVYKTSSAEHIEGGIGGMVDLRMYRPFDFAGRKLVGSARTTHTDLANKDEPQFSMLASDRWQTPGGGEFGAMINLAHQKTGWREDQDSVGAPSSNLIAGVMAPNGTTQTTSIGTRDRDAINFALQWRPTDTLELYAEGGYNRLKTYQDSYQLAAGGWESYFPTNPKRLAPTISAGSLTLFPGTSDLASVTWTNAPLLLSSFARDTSDKTMQLAIGGSWTQRALTLKTDMSYTKSKNTLFFSGVNLSPNNGSINLDGSTNLGTVTLTQNLSTNIPSSSISTNLTDPSTLRVSNSLYTTRVFEGDLFTAQFDGEYEFDESFLKSLLAGIRYAKRTADNGNGTVGNNIDRINIPLSSVPGLTVGNNPYTLFDGDGATIRNFLLGSLAKARSDPGLRKTLGLSNTFATTGNVFSLWSIEETTAASYLMGKFKSSTAPIDGNAGIRIIHTDESVSGVQTNTSGAGTIPLSVDSTYTDVLPSINLRAEILPGLYIRGAASKTLTRQDFTQLNGALSLNPSANPKTGSAGNPSLNPIRADNFDIAVEKYINKNTFVYVTGFLKTVDGYVSSIQKPEIIGTDTYLITRPYNSGSVDIQGLEIGYQQFYDFLPGWLSGFGLQVNYTYVDSMPEGKALPLQQVSPNSYNIIGMYEKYGISARLAYSWRDKYINSIATVAGVPTPVYVDSYGWLDASLGYRFNDKVTVTIEGSNLLGTLRKSYYGVKTRPESVWLNDRQISAIVTVNF